MKEAFDQGGVDGALSTGLDNTISLLQASKRFQRSKRPTRGPPSRNPRNPPSNRISGSYMNVDANLGRYRAQDPTRKRLVRNVHDRAPNTPNPIQNSLARSGLNGYRNSFDGAPRIANTVISKNNYAGKVQGGQATLNHRVGGQTARKPSNYRNSS